MTVNANANAFGFMARLSSRERAMVGGLLIFFFVFSLGVLFILRSRWFSETEEEITGLRAGLDLVRTRGTAYDTKKKEKAAREARIANVQPISFSMLLEEAEKGLVPPSSLRGQEEKPQYDAGNGLIKRSVTFEVRTVGLEELLGFLTKLEAQPGNILFVERINVRSPSSVEDRLNAEVELTTWELKPQQPEDAAPAAAPEEEAP